MFFNQDDDDQDFLSPTGGSKLASLFGMDQASIQGGNESLTYTAPKEPKKKKGADGAADVAAAESEGPAVLYAIAAHCYKYIEGKYTSQGKLGVAVLGNHAAQDYKILLYITKEKQVTHAQLSPGFTLTLLPNKYVSFYDDMRQGWSVMFDTEDNVIAFTKQVAIAKGNSAGGSLETVITQDLALGEGGPLESNDSAEIKYIGNLLQNHTTGQEFDSNATADKLFRFKLGKGKVIKGWEIGVLGMKKAGRRLLVVPPSLGYGASGMGPRVPPAATLIFDIEVVRVKLAKPYTEPTITAAATEQAPATPTTQTPVPQPQEAEVTSAPVSEVESDSVKSRTKSISDQLSQSKTDKAKLISRMAKMGKPMIPLSGTVAGDVDQSDDDTQDTALQSEEVSLRPSLPPKPTTTPRTASSPAPSPAPSTVPVQQTPVVVGPSMYPQVASQQQAFPTNQQGAAPQPLVNPTVFQGVQMPSQMAVYQSQMPQAFLNPYQQSQYGFQQQQPQYPGTQQPMGGPGSAQADLHTPVLLSEARQQNTEVRLSLSKLQDKVEKIHEKLDHINSSHGGPAMALGLPGGMGMAGAMPTMETNILLHSIQRIVQENERLKKEIFEKNARIESQNDKISDLLQRNQKYMEQSNDMLEQRNDSFKTTAAQSQIRLLELEQERVELVQHLAAERAQVGTLRLEAAGATKREMDLRHQLETSVGSSEASREHLTELRVDNADLASRLEQATTSLKEEKLTRKQCEDQLSTVQDDLAELKITCETLEKNLAERKKKAVVEKKRLEEEIEELKSQQEEEIQSLKDKLRKQKDSTEASASEQVAGIEEDLTKEWTEKCERLLASAAEKHQRALQDLEEEKERVEEQLVTMEKKVANAKAAKGDTNKQVEQLQADVDSLKAWKDKYETLRTQAASMKERYEERMSELETEREKIIADAQEAINRARDTGGAGSGKDVLVAEVKKIMNSVYHELKGEFDAGKSYKGADIHGVILNTVKSTTMKMVRSQEKDENSGDEGAEEDDYDEGEESEELVSEEEDAVEKLTLTPTQVQPKDPALGSLEAQTIPHESEQSQHDSLKQNGSEDDAEHNIKQTGLSAGQTESKTVVQDDALHGLIKEGVAEPMEVAGVASKVSAPPSASGGKKNDTPAKAKDSSDAKKPKTDSVTVPEVAMVTGDKGNPFYAEELRKAAEKAKEEQAKLGTTAKPESKESPVQPIVAPITGDKGNPFYAEELRKAAEAAKASKGTPQKSATAGKIEAPVSLSTTAAAKPPVKPVEVQKTTAPHKDAKDTKEKAGVLGDKGNPYYAEELRQAAEAAKDKAAKEKAETAPVIGDKGNPYYAAELEGKTLEHKHADPTKRCEADVLAGIENAMLAFGGICDTQTKKEKESDNKSQKEKKEDKKEEKKDDKSKAATGVDKKSDKEDVTKTSKKDTSQASAKPADTKKSAKDAKKGSDSEDVKKKK